uniref:hypothetical protein n=1 Tax=Castellaniella defragrans TaxID=75697 RepID=UPI00333F8EFB
MAVWPTYARLLVDGYNEAPDFGVLRTEMDGGIAKQRARWSKPIITRSATIAVFSDAEKEAFDAWIDSDLMGGVMWFDWQVPRTDRIVQARIVEGKYQWSEPAGQIWKATCQIETIGR